MTYSPFVFDSFVSDEDVHNVDGLAESLGVCLSDDCAINDVDPLTNFLLNNLYRDLQDLNTVCQADSYRLIDHVRTWYAVTPRKKPHDILNDRVLKPDLHLWGRDQYGNGLFNAVAGGPFVFSFSPYVNPKLLEQDDSGLKLWCKNLADRVQGFVDDHASGLLEPLTVVVFPPGANLYNAESGKAITIALIGNVSRRELKARMDSQVGTLFRGVLSQRHGSVGRLDYSFYDYALESAVTNVYGDTPFGDFVENILFEDEYDYEGLKGINCLEDLEDYLETVSSNLHTYYYTLWYDFNRVTDSLY